MEGIVALFIWATIGSISMHIAQQKRRSQYLWLFLGLVFGIFALIVIALLPPV